jgi:hypothetical protein
MTVTRDCRMPHEPGSSYGNILTMSGARVYDGHEWVPVEETVGHTGSQAPVPPVKEGDGSIFVSLPSFRGKYCSTVGLRAAALLVRE